MQGRKLIVAIAVLFISSCPLLLHSQQLQAVLNGTVTDPSGAVVSNASVTVTQEEGTTAPRTVNTNQQGSYTIPDLPAGDYDISVSAPGFQKFQATHVTLFVAQTLTVNAKLSTGTVSQTVTVQQNAVVPDTTTSEVAGTISGTQVRQLQLNNRNFEQLVTLQPGVVSALPDEVGFGLNNTDQVAVNGARGSANNWTVDGADINDSGSNLTLLNVPSVDAIQEFTLERSTYDAGFGRSAGGQVLVATRSGTSQFHGDAYEFDRNTIFNANNYFNKQTTPITPRAIEHYNDFGFTIGGPLYVPRVLNRNRNKLFFFWSEEWRKVSAPETSSALPPTAAELAGNFTGNLTASAPAGCVAYNATTNTSTISPSCYSKNANVYLTNVFSKFSSNTPSGLYTFSYSQPENTREDLVRVDANLTDKLHFFARAMRDETPESFPMGLFAGTQFPSVAADTVNAPGDNVVGNLTWTISPRMVNEAEFAYTQGTINSSFASGDVINSSAIGSALTNNTAYTDPYGRIPNIAFKDGTTGINSGAAPYFERNLDRTLFDNFSLTLGNHSIRAGATVSNMLKTENAYSGAANFTFNNFADFLLGDAYEYTQASKDTVPDLHYFNFEAYLQDDWKVTPKLTLNLGVRYSYFPSPADVKNTLVNFDPLLFDPNAAPAIDPVSGNFTASSGQVPATYANGLIFPTGSECTAAKSIASLANCSPYGSHVNPDPTDNFGPRFGFAWAPYGNGSTAIHGGYGIFYDRTLNGIWEDNAFFDPPLVQTSTVLNTSFDNPLGGTKAVSLAPNAIYSTGNPYMKTPTIMDYNLSLEQQLGTGTVFQLAYVGNQARHLLGERDLNQPTLTERAADPTAWVTAVLPYRGYSTFVSLVPEYNANYNSLQAFLTHRTRNLTLQIAYTWSRSLTTESNDRGTATYDTYNVGADYGPSETNQPNTFVANYVYNLPFFEKQHGFAGHALGGWALSGITQITSGQSVIITQALDPFDCVTPAGATTGCAAGTYPGGINIDSSVIAPRPDQIAPVHMVKKQTQWFSTSSFADAVGHFGDSPNGPLLSPGLDLWDLSAIKNFSLGERAKLELRGEFFNAFNHTNFGAPALSGGGIGTNVDYSDFGQVVSAHDPRQIQLGGKLIF